MDANGTRYHLLLGEEDWASCTDVTHVHAPASCTDATHVHAPVLLYNAWHALPKKSNSAALAWDERRDESTYSHACFRPHKCRRSIRSACGGAQAVIAMELVLGQRNRTRGARERTGTGTTSHFWSVEDSVGCVASASPGSFQPVQANLPPTPLLFSGLAVTEDHYLVVGRVDQDGVLTGLLIFDLHAGGAPSQMDWPQNVRGEPIDMTPMPGGGSGSWIRPGSKQYRYWALDRHFNVISPDRSGASATPAQLDIFQPGEESQADDQQRKMIYAGNLALDTAFPLFDVQEATAIEALPDGTILILDRNRENRISRSSIATV